MADIGSPNWFWQQLGYTVEREEQPLGTRRTIRRPDGSAVPVDLGAARDRHDAEFIAIAREINHG